ncbi:hypothetical protein JW935_23780 [candidate division KSB1 bacterium]|nr:hypothetical protein [candidate division KSB1 bacterium]
MISKYRLLSIILFFLLFQCAKNVPVEEKILVTVGDRTISVDEFRRRTELTVRPDIPAQDRKTYKKTLLKNLIYEKMFAMEAGDSNRVAQSKGFQAFIKGIQEQTMRERLYYKQAIDKVELDSSDIKKAYQLASREYDVEFYSIHNNKLGQELSAKIKSSPDSAAYLFTQLGDKAKRPKHTVKFRDPDDQRIHEALFSAPLDTGTVLGPIQVDDANWIIMRVADYRIVPAIGFDAAIRYQQVKEKLAQNQAHTRWWQYVKEVMKGKRIEFNPETFKMLADLFYRVEQAQEAREKNAILKAFWQGDEGGMTAGQLMDEEDILDLPFFELDGELWTVGDFRQALMSHPLVYRPQQFENLPWREKFRLAVVDLVRDVFLTKEAYKQKLDQDPEVKRIKSMWIDATVAIDFRNQVLKSAKQRDDIDTSSNLAMNRFFDGYLDDLWKKYNDQMIIDEAALDSIELTRVNLFAMQPGAPYPVASPAFFFVTTQTLADSVVKPPVAE